MDKRFIPLKSWVFFELLVNTGALIWIIYTHLWGRSGFWDVDVQILLGAIFLLTRTFLLFRAWYGLAYRPYWEPDSEGDGAPDDSTPADKSSKKKLSDPVE